MLIHLICAARPNFMKIAPLFHVLKEQAWADPLIVHTGQHYDANMSDTFFEDLGLPKPDISLGVGSGTHAEQTGKVMIAYEKVLLDRRPDLVVVVGDVNSTIAASLAAVKLGIKVAHLEAGLRSNDRTMPEEINRLATDAISDFLWTPSPDADENLLREGVHQDKIARVGNIMIDSLEMMRRKIESKAEYPAFGLDEKEYAVITLHRPSNVDDASTLGEICNILSRISVELPLIFPVHPRTRKQLNENNLLPVLEKTGRIFLPEPYSYVRFMNLVFNCRAVITDSGGLQEETSYLDIPCLTLRDNTERPITISHGTNQLTTIDQLEEKLKEIIAGKVKRKKALDLWDGNTAVRIASHLQSIVSS